MAATQAIAPPSLALIMVELANCVCTELTASGAGTPCWCGISAGEFVDWTYCGSCDNDRCGMGWVRMVNVFPYTEFGVPAIDDRCTAPLMATVEVGAARCLPVLADGEMIDPTTMANVAVDQMLDAMALYRAIKCCAADMAPGIYTPAGPNGGCVGGFWTAFAPLD